MDACRPCDPRISGHKLDLLACCWRGRGASARERYDHHPDDKQHLPCCHALASRLLNNVALPSWERRCWQLAGVGHSPPRPQRLRVGLLRIAVLLCCFLTGRWVHRAARLVRPLVAALYVGRAILVGLDAWLCTVKAEWPLTTTSRHSPLEVNNVGGVSAGVSSSFADQVPEHPPPRGGGGLRRVRVWNGKKSSQTGSAQSRTYRSRLRHPPYSVTIS